MNEISSVLFSTNLIGVGIFRCPITYPLFANTGPIDGHILVFPRTSVLITHEGRQPIVADPNVVMLYNEGQVYQRGPLSPRGDLCDWFSFNLDAIVETIRPFDPAVEEVWERPFTFTHSPSDPQIYLLQRLVLNHLMQSETPDTLFVEEAMLAVLRHVVQNVYGATAVKETKRQNRAHAELTEAVKRLVVKNYQDKLSLEDIAAQVHCSPYHLCRVFQQQCGLTIHSYLNQVRLRTSLEYLADAQTDLTQLGLRLGYSSHSHFSYAFKQTFQTTPSTVRDQSPARQLRQMRNFLIA